MAFRFTTHYFFTFLLLTLTVIPAKMAGYAAKDQLPKHIITLDYLHTYRALILLAFVITGLILLKYQKFYFVFCRRADIWYNFAKLAVILSYFSLSILTILWRRDIISWELKKQESGSIIQVLACSPCYIHDCAAWFKQCIASAKLDSSKESDNVVTYSQRQMEKQKKIYLFDITNFTILVSDFVLIPLLILLFLRYRERNTVRELY